MKYFALYCAAWYLWVPVTFWFGRVFCRYGCPVGLSQSLANLVFHPKTHVRRVCTRLPRSRVQRVFNWTVVLLYFLTPIGVYVNPWGVFGRVLVGFVPGIVFFAAVLATAAVGKGRFWCNWICPFGTIFDLVARLGWHEDRVGRGCGNCRRCFAAERPAGGGADGATEVPREGVSRRSVLKGVGALAAVEVAEKTTDGGYAPVSLPGVPERRLPVLPPGAESQRAFALRCVGCGLCTKACPERVLRLSADWRRFGRPEMDFRTGYCRLACDYRCGAVCPTGALAVPKGFARRDVHPGCAVWRRDLCLRVAKREACTACVRKCPVGAIHLEGGFPVVDRAVCIGCGACEHVCPARPLPAISVEGVEVTRRVKPMGEEDLVAEMKRLLADGASVVTARNGLIERRETGRGVEPVLRLLEAGGLKGRIVADRVVGRAAAAVFLAGGAKSVFGRVMSVDAAAFLKAGGVGVSADEFVPRILDRGRAGTCPLEAAVESLDDPSAMVSVLRSAGGGRTE